jgi:hypothetical protein
MPAPVLRYSRGMVRVLAVAFIAAVTVVSAAVAGTSGPNVHGRLDRSGAGSPGCFPGEPCDPIPVGRFVTFSRPGHDSVRARVRPNGSFALRLPPGKYRISLAPPPLSGHVRPATVRVPRGHVMHLMLTIRH